MDKGTVNINIKRKVIGIIKKNYKSLENVIKEELELASNHNGLSGHSREIRWINFLRKIIPQKFAMEQGVIIMDSHGRVSKEVDIVVFDNQYTPYLFQYGALKFIPIEAVAIVIECKSDDWKSNLLKEWCKTIDDLETAACGMARMVNGYCISYTSDSQKSTKPIKILATTKPNPRDKTKETVRSCFDIIIYERRNAKANSIEIDIPNVDKSFGWWGNYLNIKNSEELKHIDGIDLNSTKNEERNKKNIEELKKNYKYLYFCNKGKLTNTLRHLEIKGQPLLSLNFQLNQLLMLINNPMLFPHLAYAQLFQNAEGRTNPQRRSNKTAK